MSAHTPGPWSLGGGTGYKNQMAIEPSIGCVYGDPETCVANGNLIAVAPDLGRLLKYVVAYSGATAAFPGGWLEDARAALAKAGL